MSCELIEESRTSSLSGAGPLRIGPWHEGVDIFGEMTVCEADEEIAQIGVGLNAVHLAASDQTGEPGPIAAVLVMTGE